MVLEESTADSSWGDNATLPDSSEISVDHLYLDRYPGPLPIIGPMFGFTRTRIRRVLASEQALGRQFLQRPLNRAELEAMAAIACQRQRTLSYAPPLGVAGGLFRAWQTRETWKLPFWKMGEDFNPAEMKMFPGGPVLLRGEIAKSAWRGLRTGLYCMNGVAFAMLFFVPYGASSASLTMTRDSRLRELVAAMTESIKAKRHEQMQRRRGQAPGDDRDPAELWRDHRESMGERRGMPQRGRVQGSGMAGSEQTFDDASPTGGAPATDDAYAFGSTQPANSSAGWDRYSSRPQQQTDSAASRQAQQWNRRTAPSQEQQSQSYYDWDDASPTAPSTPQRPAAGSSPESSGSAWARLRQQSSNEDAAQTEQQSQWQQRRNNQQGPSWGDGPKSRDQFSFSGAEQDRQLAKNEAQRDFDARIERERQGGDFRSGGGNSGKPW